MRLDLVMCSQASRRSQVHRRNFASAASQTATFCVWNSVAVRFSVLHRVPLIAVHFATLHHTRDAVTRRVNGVSTNVSAASIKLARKKNPRNRFERDKVDICEIVFNGYRDINIIFFFKHSRYHHFRCYRNIRHVQISSFQGHTRESRVKYREPKTDRWNREVDRHRIVGRNDRRLWRKVFTHNFAVF